MKKLLKKFNNQSIRLLFIPLFVSILGFGVAYGLGSSRSGSGVVSAACKSTCVLLGPDKASPDTITVIAGSTVQFNSADGKSHNLSLGEGGEEHEHRGKFYSGEFKSDEAWQVQFNDDGAFTFHDHLNPKISVVVIVYTPGKDYRIR
jgi:plastocyanin